METPAKTRGSFDLPDEAIADLERVSQVLARSADQGASLEAAIEGVVTLGDVASKVRSELQASEDDAARFVRTFISLHSLRRSLRLTPSEILGEVNRAITMDETPPWFKSWEGSLRTVERLLSPQHPLASLEKAMNLAYEYQNVATELQLLTDIRPIFNDSLTKVDRTVLSFVLRIGYHDGAHRHDLDLALDAMDVENLRLLCERAQAKMRVIKEQGGVLAPVSVAGEIER